MVRCNYIRSHVYDMLEKYLVYQGETMMLDCLKVNAANTHKMLTWTHTKLGWNNFADGRICKLSLEVVASMFS